MAGAAVFIIIGILLVWMAGTDGFINAFAHMFVLFTVVNLYDLVIIDWLLFQNIKRFRIPGTEDMHREYHNYWFHFKGFLRGIAIGFIISLIVAAIYTFIHLLL